MRNILTFSLIICCISAFGQTSSFRKYFVVENEYVWVDSISDFTTVASKKIGETRIINVSPDFSSVEIVFVLGIDSISVVTEVVNVVKAEELTILYLKDKDDYPYLLESNIEGNYSLYYKYKNDNSGYNGFQAGERLKYTNK